MKINRRNIWNFSQNKPSQIVEDFLSLIKPYRFLDGPISKSGKTYSEIRWAGDVYEILLRRGVFKWLAVRRKLIKLKNKWKEDETRILESGGSCQVGGKNRSPEYMRGYLAATRAHRADVRALCHSDRWQVPDHDSKAKQWLEKYELPEGVKIRKWPLNLGVEMWGFDKGDGFGIYGPFKTPEEAVADCLSRENNNVTLVRRTSPPIDRSTEGYDANGSPVPPMRWWWSP